MKTNPVKLLTKLFEEWAQEPLLQIKPLPPSGSNRNYFRLNSQSKSAIGVFNTDRKENEAFLSFTNQFLKEKLNVPKIYHADIDNNVYLQQDLGDITLYSTLNSNKTEIEIKKIYQSVIETLLKFQIIAGKQIDYTKCYPRAAFDKQSMMWDLNYFKYYFLKLSKTPFDEQNLENDFNTLIEFLIKADCQYFLYRDMQSRNIMLFNEIPYFIDYQGGRKGALYYDIASLLFDAKANLAPTLRNELLDFYFEKLKFYIQLDKEEFEKFYYAYVLIRILQAMGTYGFRGLYEKKEHFLQSIPFAVKNIEWLINTKQLPNKLPELTKAIKNIVDQENLKNKNNDSQGLTINIQSFSYRKGIPQDNSGNGGGFVFDCRALHNPGRYNEYKNQNGTDKAVIDFLKKQTETDEYLTHVFALVDKSIEKYIKRNFTNLMVSFGCTGGRHRSVYCAEQLAMHLKENFNISITLTHTEKENWQ